MIKKCLLLAVMALWLAGCYKPYAQPKFAPRENPRVTGIADVLKQRSEVDVLMIHGMCTHGRGWVQQSNDNLLASLGSTQQVDRDALQPVTFGEETELYSLTFDIDGKTLRTHAIVWSPATDPLKSDLCYDVVDRDSTNWRERCDPALPKYGYSRARLNETLKDKMLNDCFADAFIYIGHKRRGIQKQVSEAIVHAARAAATPPGEAPIPLFIISESLGSKVLFDTLMYMYHSGEEEIVNQTLARVEQVFMGANQIPILSLGAPPRQSADRALLREPAGDDAEGAAATGFQALPEMIQKLREKRRGEAPTPLRERPVLDKPLQIVVFSDPNDLFSYTLRDSRIAQMPECDIVDVIVSNSDTVFGYLENPGEAHGGYRDSDVVHKIIVCGIPGWEDCDLK